MAKDPKPEDSRAARGFTPRGSSAAGKKPPQRGRTRPPANVVTAQKPWGLIAGAVAVVVFAAAVLTYAVVQVNRSNADRVTSADQIAGLQTYDYAAGQDHVSTPVTYTESPPVGGAHDPEWADCTGTVYDVDIRHENAVHSLEHGATWITYDPDTISDDDLATLEDVVRGNSGLMLSPYDGLGSTISLQSWNHQLAVDSATDLRVQQFVDFLTKNADVAGHYPEIGASCENPTFISDPLVEGHSSRSATSTDVATDAPTTPTATTPAP
ncbi:Protein of unknown function [Modestobacter sp. DSM 44400]|uniref:DUF3105 domain-containing protein n=1 Tax=Modestobacter sp. DSM 44400 TaxID=1550230 RepID=UPI0008996A11|nr:DUF3105 domain-containing protein [Modestobacter sp. DSM 44400]SDX65019.1 Protein of unknown function [Modestobacter sp. DSM 44400]